jgi:alkylhydroperoxidase/carboxymuconolactone decarboxylase family protein YurZ
MARIEGVPKNKAGIIARISYWWTNRLLGKIPEPMKIAAHHTKLFTANLIFESVLMKSRTLQERLKALAALKVATLIGCPF